METGVKGFACPAEPNSRETAGNRTTGEVSEALQRVDVTSGGVLERFDLDLSNLFPRMLQLHSSQGWLWERSLEWQWGARGVSPAGGSCCRHRTSFLRMLRTPKSDKIHKSDLFLFSQPSALKSLKQDGKKGCWALLSLGAQSQTSELGLEERDANPTPCRITSHLLPFARAQSRQNNPEQKILRSPKPTTHFDKIFNVDKIFQ